jgi:putative solute:sodium symporter small subunit
MTRQTYWRRQLRRTVVLLLIWAFVGFGMSILFVEELNTVSIIGIPFGFWMAQQGSILVFIALIFAYAYLSGKADEEAGVAE